MPAITQEDVKFHCPLSDDAKNKLDNNFHETQNFISTCIENTEYALIKENMNDLATFA